MALQSIFQSCNSFLMEILFKNCDLYLFSHQPWLTIELFLKRVLYIPVCHSLYHCDSLIVRNKLFPKETSLLEHWKGISFVADRDRYSVRSMIYKTH